jgi:hypothetical protein
MTYSWMSLLNTISVRAAETDGNRRRSAQIMGVSRFIASCPIPWDGSDINRFIVTQTARRGLYSKPAPRMGESGLGI